MNTFNNGAVGALEFTVIWERDGIAHKEWFLGRRFNAVNDIFPHGMREALEGKQQGESVSFTYQPRKCIPRHRESLVRTFTLDRLRKKTVFGRPIIPRLRRYYPQGHIDGLMHIYPDTLTPFRLIGLDTETFVADCNHPLAQSAVNIEAKINYIEERETGTYGSLTHWRETVCDWGPGMQGRFQNQPTDFFLPGFFDRKIKDSSFQTPALDAQAEKNMQKIFSRHLNPDARILDFSLGAHDVVHGEYDGAVCILSIEYMADPVLVLKTVRSRLAPCSPVLIGFSNHFDPERCIQGWADIHEFERMGLVLEYLRQAGLDVHAGTISIRNDWRDKDDPKFLEARGVSDPVYVVYGHKP